jgi:hypothetical protein
MACDELWTTDGRSRHSVDLRNSGGEGGIRTPGTSFSRYNGLANPNWVLTRSENSRLYYISQRLTKMAYVPFWRYLSRFEQRTTTISLHPR